MDRIAFAFDLDGTVTRQELLPIIASEVDLTREMRLLTDLTLEGKIPFEDSFRLRCAILRSVPVSRVRDLVQAVEIDADIGDFIRENRERCFIVTGNLDCWISPIVDRLGCKAFTSQSMVQGDRLVALGEVLRKSKPISQLKNEFQCVVAIGESFNDLPMFEVADVGVAFGGVHDPVDAIVQAADYVTYKGSSLCRLLRTL